MVAPIRYTSQKQQEKRSLRQISERLDEFGWSPTRPDEDLGEDLIVHIYFEGKATGVLFHLQAKSVTNLYERQQDEIVPYRFKVKDLLHWEQFELSVVLMVWDVHLREGRWVLLHTAVAQLDRDNPGWREQKTATVYLPWQNTTDDDGLIELRKGIGRFLYPQLSRNKSIEIKWEAISGLENLETFKYWLKTGMPVTLKNVLFQWNYPEWHEKWFGKRLAERTDLPLPSHLATIERPVDISIKDNHGNIAFLSGLHFKAELSDGVALFSNRHQTTYPFQFELYFREVDLTSNQFKKTEIKLTQNNLGSNVSITRDLLKFRQCLANGGTLTLTILDSDHFSVDLPIFPDSELAPNPRFVEIVEKLYKIQNVTGTLFRVPDKGFTDVQEIQAIEKTWQAFEYGKVITEYKAIKITKIQEENLPIILEFCRQNPTIRFMPTYEGFENSFLGKNISLGRVTRCIMGDMSVEEIENAIQTLKSDQPAPLRMNNVEILDIFPDCYIKEAKRLTKLLAEKFDVEAIYLFGSLAWGERWNPQTDIDLAVRGLAPEKFFKAIGYLEGETKFPFDLITLETAPEFLRERILTRGRKLYGK